jgi:glutamyl-tRNA reductase
MSASGVLHDELQRRGDDIRRAEIDKVVRKLGPLTSEQERALDALTSAIVARLLNHAVVQIEKMTDEERSWAWSVVRTLLGLA